MCVIVWFCISLGCFGGERRLFEQRFPETRVNPVKKLRIDNIVFLVQKKKVRVQNMVGGLEKKCATAKVTFLRFCTFFFFSFSKKLKISILPLRPSHIFFKKWVATPKLFFISHKQKNIRIVTHDAKYLVVQVAP